MNLQKLKQEGANVMLNKFSQIETFLLHLNIIHCSSIYSQFNLYRVCSLTSSMHMFYQSLMYEFNIVCIHVHVHNKCDFKIQLNIPINLLNTPRNKTCDCKKKM